MSRFDKILYTVFIVFLAILFTKIFFLVLLVVLLLLWIRTWQMGKEPNHAEFLAGRLPNPKPNGLYEGSVGFETSWMGKKFDAEHATGVNVFKDKKARHNAAPHDGKTIERYSFKTSATSSLLDENLVVLNIDYNVKGNPLWLKFVVDELVEIAPDHYLGKMNLKIIPGIPFSVVYFELKR